ncbi:MAG: sugar O-acetyltransferase [Bifidobacteriaceae bacterium]|jgi:maltose O-acetyltransferase|nr:sugar O-acetyltransferase [Bifidobacteriaceae bacterium]
MRRTDKPEDRAAETSKMSIFEKASNNEWYVFDSELDTIRGPALRKQAQINQLALENEEAAKKELLELFPGIHPSAIVLCPIKVEYPKRLEIGEKTFVHQGFYHLALGKVTIGKHCFIGPNVHFYTTTHEISDLERRRAAWQYDEPITVGDDVWFGGDVIVCPGVTIENNVVIAAGSVVTKDIPPNVIIGGNPAKIIRKI